jgi:7,8-dihydropterin-6-yl-methyl-4-(beta-D-ribofuranosyl)aminobenzene 5'-phosphate synthase
MTTRIGRLAITLLLSSLITIGCVESAGHPTPAEQETHTPVESPSQESPTPTAIPTEFIVPTTSVLVAKITIVYDNTLFDDRLSADWGFAAVVEIAGSTILFDTGGNGAMLIDNIQQLGFDPLDIDTIVLSHEHRDHVGGFPDILALGVEPTMYLPSSFPSSIKSIASSHGVLVEVSDSMEIFPGVFTTGELGGDIIEQALVLETPEGSVVVTGCAHPGIIEILERAKEITGEEIDLVLGGFHTKDHTPSEVESIIDDFRRLGVKQVAPAHCSGGSAKSAFAKENGENYLEGGVGRIFLNGPG